MRVQGAGVALALELFGSGLSSHSMRALLRRPGRKRLDVGRVTGRPLLVDEPPLRPELVDVEPEPVLRDSPGRSEELLNTREELWSIVRRLDEDDDDSVVSGRSSSSTSKTASGCDSPSGCADLVVLLVRGRRLVGVSSLVTGSGAISSTDSSSPMSNEAVATGRAYRRGTASPVVVLCILSSAMVAESLFSS